MVSADTDWKAVFIEAIHQTVLPLALEAAMTLPEAVRPSEEQLGPFRDYATRQAVKNERLMAEQDRLLKAFAEQSIPCVILKGSSAAAPYPKPELRVLGDIDLLISRETLGRAGEAMTALGYRQAACNEEFHLGFAGSAAYVELHFEASFFPESAAGKALRALMEGALTSPDTATMSGYGFPALSPERQAVSLLIHMQRHMKALGIGLRHLCDFAMYLSRLAPGEWERAVMPALQAGGLLRFAQVMAKTCVLHLGLPAASVPWCAGVRDRLCADLLALFLRSGNFGRKDPGGRASSVLSADKEGLGQARFMPLAAVRNINLYAYKHYPLARRAPLLLPFFWAYLPLRYLRKNKADIAATFSSARAKRTLFAQLGLLETDRDVRAL